MATSPTISKGSTTGAASSATAKVALATDLNLDPAKGTVFSDSNSTIPASGTYLGPTRAYTATKRVAVRALAASPGVWYFQESTDGGSTFADFLLESCPADDDTCSVVTPAGSVTHYRLKFVNGPVGCKRIGTVTQMIT
jgi:hypothetical protein